MSERRRRRFAKAPRSDAGERGSTLGVIAIRVGMAALVLGGWTYGNASGAVSPLLLPSIPDVVQSLWVELRDMGTWRAALITAGEFVAAFAIATSVGILAGFWASRTRYRAAVWEPMMNWGYMVPFVVFFPLFILWFGVGVQSKIAYGAMSAVFPIAVSSLRGFMGVNPAYIRVGRAFGASSRQIDLSIKIRAAMPMVLAGLRIGAAISLICVVLGEMLASVQGLGYQLASSSQKFQTDRTYAMILIILALVGVLLHFTKKLEVSRDKR